MNKNTFRKIVENKGWVIDDEGDTLRISQYSPAGEDFSFNISKDTTDKMVTEIKEYADEFDGSEHIEMWVEAKHSGTSGIPSIKELCEDAKDIQMMLIDLANALTKESEAK